MRFLYAAAALFLSLAVCYAADVADSGKVTIYADNMRSSDGGNRVSFTNNVVAANSIYTLTADRAEVFSPDGNTIKTIQCFSNVNIKTADLLALSNFADIDVEKKTITVFGNARIWQENNYMEADRVVFNYVTKEISIFKGSHERVRVIVSPQED
jgi:lipopolysaccharide transport protein LptA